jgi:hypothetical protein
MIVGLLAFQIVAPVATNDVAAAVAILIDATLTPHAFVALGGDDVTKFHSMSFAI